MMMMMMMMLNSYQDVGDGLICFALLFEIM
jgi:hypothetical protein